MLQIQYVIICALINISDRINIILSNDTIVGSSLEQFNKFDIASNCYNNDCKNINNKMAFDYSTKTEIFNMNSHYTHNKLIVGKLLKVLLHGLCVINLRKQLNITCGLTKFIIVIYSKGFIIECVNGTRLVYERNGNNTKNDIKEIYKQINKLLIGNNNQSIEITILCMSQQSEEQIGCIIKSLFEEYEEIDKDEIEFIYNKMILNLESVRAEHGIKHIRLSDCSVYLDLEPFVIDEDKVQTGTQLFYVDNLVSDKEDASNNYALVDSCLVDNCPGSLLLATVSVDCGELASGRSTSNAVLNGSKLLRTNSFIWN